MERKSYRSDLTDKQWQLIAPHLPPEKNRGRPRTTNLREVVNALLYQLRTGCQWDMMPEGFPPKSTVNGYFNSWKRDGTLDEINRVLRENIRIKEGRNRMPSAAIIGRILRSLPFAAILEKRLPILLLRTVGSIPNHKLQNHHCPVKC